MQSDIDEEEAWKREEKIRLKSWSASGKPVDVVERGPVLSNLISIPGRGLRVTNP
jgi:hypothetical protein